MAGFNGVYIPVEEFTEYVKKAEMLDNVMRAVYVGADLSWNKKELCLNRDSLNDYLCVADSRRYWDVYNALKAEVEKEDEKNEAV